MNRPKVPNQVSCAPRIHNSTAWSAEERTMQYEESRLYRLRHSAAHLMAQAVTELYPGSKLAIGPPIENGFYYDIALPEPIKEEDLEQIEKRMRELAKLGQPIVRRVAKDREEAKRIIIEECTLGQGEETALYKLRLLEAVPEGEEVSFYDQQADGHRFIDLCRGPHVENTSEIEHFKLMSIAGAYWRGDASNEQLTRIYGTAFESDEDLAQHLEFLAEAKRRDHRALGRELGLFMFSQTVGQGLALWLPKGATIRGVLEDFLKEEQLRQGYDPVVTPHIGSIKLYEKSGHILTYRQKMFPFMVDEEKETFILKPMNCPFHIEIYRSSLRSYRELPIRYAEFGTVYRYEQSGELAGMLRVRGFTQDDAHIFCAPEQLLQEFKSVVDIMMVVLKQLGLEEYRVRLGTRDPEDTKYVGHEENWKLAESAIIQACDELGLEYEISPGDAAFYGPKLDLIIRDALRREWQMGTVQVDYNLPERFDLEYIGEDGKPHRPVMIHRAPFGSLERMIGLLTEQYAGAFPYWLAPVQVVVLPIADRHNAYAEQVRGEIRSAGVRCTVDDRRETLGKKIRENQGQKVPYMLVLGDRDLEAGTVSVRCREDGDLGAMAPSDFLDLLASQ
ncbi:MAG: threonine--tRNA ligase [Fimbriimonadaceae bacterium]